MNHNIISKDIKIIMNDVYGNGKYIDAMFDYLTNIYSKGFDGNGEIMYKNLAVRYFISTYTFRY